MQEHRTDTAKPLREDWASSVSGVCVTATHIDMKWSKYAEPATPTENNSQRQQPEATVSVREGERELNAHRQAIQHTHAYTHTRARARRNSRT
jgi:hypothetical protein